MNRTAQIILYVFSGLIAYVFFVIMVFPLDTMISHFLSKLEEETKGDLRISVSEIDASLLFDSEFKDFRVFKSDKEIFFTPKLSVSMSPLSMLGEVIDVGFEADYKKGDIAGRISLSQKRDKFL